MGRIANSVKFLFRWLPWVVTGTSSTYRSLSEESKEEIKVVVKEPRKWGESIESTWDSTKIGAEHFKETSGILANILIGRRVSRKERLQARDDLASLSIIVTPLRFFMIPGSQVLLGIMARVTPWRLIPDEWIPINALKKARGEPDSIEKEVGMVMRLIGR